MVMRKRWLMLICVLLISMIFTACAADTENSAALSQPSKDEVIELLEQAATLDGSVYSESGLTTEQLYDFYKPYFTKKYVDEVVMPGGNLMIKDGKWVTAFVGSEPLEGTYIIPPSDGAEVRIAPPDVDGEVSVRYEVDEGLFPAHTQKLTLVLVDRIWKVHSLEW